jgi:hypothetical protein
MRFWQQEESDNPAWPGLVDIFAFSLVLIILFYLGLEKRVQELIQENLALKAELEEIIAGVPNELKDFLERLNNIIDPEKIIVKPNIPANQVEIFLAQIHNPGKKEKEPITFEIGEYKLSPDNHLRLRELTAKIFIAIKDWPLIVEINGTADPQPLNASTPPRDNTELSALRAATVASTLVGAAPEIGKQLQIVGLGVKGELLDPPPANPREAYKQFRTVGLVVRVDIIKKLKRNQILTP